MNTLLREVNKHKYIIMAHGGYIKLKATPACYDNTGYTLTCPLYFIEDSLDEKVLPLQHITIPLVKPAITTQKILRTGNIPSLLPGVQQAVQNEIRPTPAANKQDIPFNIAILLLLLSLLWILWYFFS